MADYFSQDSGAPMMARDAFGAEAKDALSSLRKNVTKLKNEGKKIGTDQDNKVLRGNLAGLMTEALKLFTICQTEIKKLLPEENASDVDKKKMQRAHKTLMEQYMKIKNDFDDIAKNISEKQKMYIENAKKAGSTAGRTKAKKGGGSAWTDKKNADGEEVNEGQWREFDEANIQSDIINQRQEDINQIEQLMHQVNAITNDMAQEVANADAKLDQIGVNAQSTKNNTKKALIDIHKGAEYQKKSYKRICCLVWLLILGLGVVATVIVLLVYNAQCFIPISNVKQYNT